MEKTAAGGSVHAKSFMVFAIVAAFVQEIATDSHDIYNSKTATSDLQWTSHSNAGDGWEEVSGYDRNGNIIRYYQVCDKNEAEQADSWIRSPYIPIQNGRRIYIEVSFSIARCLPSSPSVLSTKCKETFNLYYYEAASDVASSTFPPWRESPYKKVDTVAANSPDTINTKTFNFGPVSRSGVYVAIQDQGACMSITSIRLYYFYCHETSRNLASFPSTTAGPGVTSLETSLGRCVANARPATSTSEPNYRCSSDGQWKIFTGECVCSDGFQPNSVHTECIPCPAGTYKTSPSQACLRCPAHSGLPNTSKTSRPEAEVDKRTSPVNECPCHDGWGRAAGEEISEACTRSPSQPSQVTVNRVTASSVHLQWTSSRDDGGRRDVTYRVNCEVFNQSAWLECPSDVSAVVTSSPFADVRALRPFTRYRFTVLAENGASRNGLAPRPSTPPGANRAQANTSEAAPAVVGDIRVISSERNKLVFKWSPPLPVRGMIVAYEVEIRRKADGFTLETRTVKSSTVEVTQLRADTAYVMRVRARTAAGFGSYSGDVTARTKSSTSPTSPNVLALVAIASAIVAIAAAIAIGCWYKNTGKFLCLNISPKNKKKAKETSQQQEAPLLNETLIVDLPPRGERIYVEYPDPEAAIRRLQREISLRNLTVDEVIGTGEFAEVCRGTLRSGTGATEKVAVKRLKLGASGRDQNNFLCEASTIAQFDDPNIVQLKGVVTKGQRPMIVTEYMENKSLDQYLRLNKGELSVERLLKMLRGIASGMSYLSRMKFVHRDLAARNILLDSQLQCKVSDFGLSRTLDNDPNATYTTQGGKIALRWTAPECIRFRKFTSASDVWSYGIVAWEVMSYGEKPYWDMSNDDVVANVENGMRLPSPLGCPKPIHDTMVDCWSSDPTKRPSFDELVRRCERWLSRPEILQLAAETPAPHDKVKFRNHPPAANTSVTDSMTPSLSRAIEDGKVTSVNNWLEMQRLGSYQKQFEKCGIDSLEKVSNLTISDLKNFGISVTLHMDKLENGIRTLKRHLSTVSSTPPQSPRSSTTSTLPLGRGGHGCHDDDGDDDAIV